MKNKFLCTALFGLGLIPLVSFAMPFDPLIGTWQIINDRTGYYVSDIVIRKNSKTQQYSAVLVKVHSQSGTSISNVCHACEGEFKNKPLFGMEILNNMIANSSQTQFSQGIWLNHQDGLRYEINAHLNSTKNQLRVTGKAKNAQQTTSMTWMRLQDIE